MTDSQWEAMIESAYKRAKDALPPITSTATQVSQDDITNMIQAEVSKIAPGAPIDIVSTIQQELGRLKLSVVSTPAAAVSVATPAQAPTETPEEQTA
ncbi:MAG: hypothetical protein P4L69_18325 [Desulfosporosinus sp.]|nr:hypothetical protein [Desulfosporosinus sp.]